jgi:phosphoribosylglycinamide formyltransferase 1
MTSYCAVVVLISGNGSNLQALIDASRNGNFKIVAVISNTPSAYGLERAKNGGIPAIVLDHFGFPDRISFDQELMATIDKFHPDLLVLAGFMRILSPGFVQHYAGRILNIHPSLLPDYPGTNTHQRVLDAGEKTHGVSVHFVTEKLDAGPVIAQAKVEITADDTAKTLADRVHNKEHRIYPQVVSWFAAKRLRMDSDTVYLDSKPLPDTGVLVE